MRILTATIVAGVLIIPSTVSGTRGVSAESGATALAAEADARVQLESSARSRKEIRQAIQGSRMAKGKRTGRYERPEPYVPQTACHQAPKPGVVDFQNMLLELFPRSAESFKSYDIPGACLSPGASEHGEGRAIDFEFDYDKPVERQQASELMKWLSRDKGYHAKRLGVMYMIWDQKKWGTYNQKWRKMSDRGSKTHNHRDHIHVSFTWNGALKRSSYWSGRTRATHYGSCSKYRDQLAAYTVTPRDKPCGRGRPIPKKWYSKTTASIKPWQAGDRITRLQEYLTSAGVYDGAVNGSFGTLTFAAVQQWQKKKGVPTTGVWDRESQIQSKRAFWPRAETVVQNWSDDPVTLTEGQKLRDQVRVKSGDRYRARDVQLQRRAAGSENWTVVSRGTTAPGGRHLVEHSLPVGDWEVRLVVQDTSRLMPTVSATKDVEVVGALTPSFWSLWGTSGIRLKGAVGPLA